MTIWLNEIRPSVAGAKVESQFLRLLLQTKQNTNNHPHKIYGALHWVYQDQIHFRSRELFVVD